MNYQRIIRVLIALLAALFMVLVGYVLASIIRDDRGVVKAPDFPLIGRGGAERTLFALEVAPVATSTRLYEVSGNYPRFPGSSRLTEAIDAYVETILNEFVVASEENLAELRTSLDNPIAYPEEPYRLTLSWEPDQLSSEVLSFKMQVDAYEGVSSRQEIKTFNYDLSKREFIELRDLFSGDYLNRLSTTGRNLLRVKISSTGEFSEELLSLNTEPSAENFRNFTYSDTAVTFYFPTSVVAPVSAGPQQFSLPRK